MRCSKLRDCIFQKHVINWFSVVGMCLPWLWLRSDQQCSLPEDDHHRGQAGGEGQVGGTQSLRAAVAFYSL